MNGVGIAEFSSKDLSAAACLMVKSAFLHLALVAHELQEKRRKVRLDDEFLIKLSIIHDLTEELSKELGHK